MTNLSSSIPYKTRNISHDFRLGIYSTKQDFNKIANFSLDTASIIIKPQGITSVTWSISTSSTVTGGQFSLIGNLGGEVERDNSDVNVIINKIKGVSSISSIQNIGLNLQSIFNNTKNVINLMDYIAIFTKDPRTNRWYGSQQTSNTSIPKDAKPKFIGIISDITGTYNVAQNRIEYSIKFKNMLRIIELTRYATQNALFDEISTPIGESFNHGDVIRNALFQGTQDSGYKIIKEGLKLEYPSILLEDRIEEDKFRVVPTQIKPEFLTEGGNFFSSWDTKLNFFRNIANNKDFEFYADEDGKLVWKLPTYARGINRVNGNFVDNALFNPDNVDAKLLYHIDDFLSFNYTESENEIINFVSGVSDLNVNGIDNLDTNGSFSTLLNAYYIKGGHFLPPEKSREEKYGILNVGLRPFQFRNNLYYNLPDDNDSSNNILLQQIYFYDFKVWSNNLSKGITATLSLIDNPYIQVGMPVVIPQLAKAGFGDLKGKLLPSIFYISALSRKYEYQKAPLLTLTLTHGRYALDEFHNGIHIYDRVSEWIRQIEPSLVYDVEDRSLLNKSSHLEDLQDQVKTNLDRVETQYNNANQKDQNEVSKLDQELE